MGASICQVLGMTPSSVLKRRGAGLKGGACRRLRAVSRLWRSIFPPTIGLKPEFIG